MSKKTLTLVVLIIAFLLPVYSYGQMFGENRFSTAEPDVTTEVKYAEGLIQFKFDMNENYHITDLKNKFFTIELIKNDTIEIRDVLFPEGTPYGQEGDKVFKGKFDVNVFLKPLKEITSAITLKFQVSYQVCQEKPQELCYAPDGKTVEVTIKRPFKENAPTSIKTPVEIKNEAAPLKDLSVKTTANPKPKDGNWKITLPLSLLMLACAVFFGLSKALSDEDSVIVKFAKSFLVLLFITGAFLFITSLDIKYFPSKHTQSPVNKVTLTWLPNLEEGKALAKTEKKQLLVDTSAEWCVACKELEEYTFSDPDVAKVLGNYTRVRVDFTQKSEENEKLRADLKVIGMPTLILYDLEGKEIRRDSGFMEKDKFLGFLGASSGWFDNMMKLLKQELDKRSFLLILLVFGLGFLTSLTPCVYPVIPIVMGYIGTRSGKKKLKGFYLSIFFVLGLALVYSILGVVAAMTGSMMGASFQNPIVVIIISAIFIIMGLSLAGLFEIPVPTSISSKVQSGGFGSEVIGAMVVGGVSGIIAAPCVGPVLIALLSWISQTRNIFLGFWLTFIFSMGMGIIFLLAGTFSGVISAMPKGGKWMDYIKYFFAILLIAGGIYIINAIVPVWLYLLLWGIFIITTSVFIGLLSDSGEYTFKQRLYKFIVAIIFLVGVFTLLKSIDLVMRLPL